MDYYTFQKKTKVKFIESLITEVRKQYSAGNLSVNAYSSEIDKLKKQLKELQK